jgi:hypothetical protein
MAHGRRPLRTGVFAGLTLLAWLGASDAAAPVGSAAHLPDWSGTWRPDLGGAADARTFGLPTASKNPAELQLSAAGVAAREALSAAGKFTTAQSLCIFKGLPLEMTTTALNYEFIVEASRVTVIAENGFVRRIYTDGRGHPADPDPTFAGHSIGHWEGDTLVVDTIALLRSELGPLVVTQNTTRVQERIKRLSADKLQDEFTVTDPVALARPWKFTRQYTDVRVPMGEFVCAQNNRDNGRDAIDLTPPPG